MMDIRWIPVINTSDTPCPANGAMEPDGIETVGSTALVRVKRPTADSLTAILFNGPVEIPAYNASNPELSRGEGHQDFPCIATYTEANEDNAGPSNGDVWGTEGDSWVLAKGKEGFKVVGDGANGYCNVIREEGGSCDPTDLITDSVEIEIGKVCTTDGVVVEQELYRIRVPAAWVVSGPTCEDPEEEECCPEPEACEFCGPATLCLDFSDGIGEVGGAELRIANCGDEFGTTYANIPSVTLTQTGTCTWEGSVAIDDTYLLEGCGGAPYTFDFKLIITSDSPEGVLLFGRLYKTGPYPFDSMAGGIDIFSEYSCDPFTAAFEFTNNNTPIDYGEDPFIVERLVISEGAC